MHLPPLRLCALVLGTLASLPAAQTSEPATAAEDPILVTVQGRVIKKSEVEARFLQLVDERTRGRGLPEEQLASMRPSWHAQLLEEMIAEALLDGDAKAIGLEVTDGQCRAFLERSLLRQLQAGGLTREELGARIQSAEGITLEEFLARRSKEDGLRRSVRQIELLRKRYPDESKVTPEEVQARYERDKDSKYTKEPEVRASHILIATEGATTDEAKAEKRAEAERVLALCKAPGADFAALAKEHSTGPSGPNGGDLGFFPRNGAMVEPFAAAAFELPVGGVSGIVETQFGFHIIKVTDRREGGVEPLEEVRAVLADELFFEKIEGLRERHIAKLKESATIVYPPEQG